MVLSDLAANLSDLDENQCIGLKEPWSEDAESILVPLDSELHFPASARAQGFVYFMEVHVAKEICGVFGAQNVAPSQIAQLLIYYAQHDAFPNWVYDV